MSAAAVVPFTPIYRRYRKIKAIHNDLDRLIAAKQLVADPSVVATEFSESVRLLTERYRNQAPFRPQPRYPRPPAQLNTIVEKRDAGLHAQLPCLTPLACRCRVAEKQESRPARLLVSDAGVSSPA